MQNCGAREWLDGFQEVDKKVKMALLLGKEAEGVCNKSSSLLLSLLEQLEQYIAFN